MIKLKYLLLAFSLFINYNSNNISTSNLMYNDKIKTVSEIEFLLNDTKENYDIPEISGPVENLPWRNDKDFLDAKEKYNTPILMAGFCAVLKNPLPGEEHNVALAAKGVKNIVVKPNKVFSQNSSIGPYVEKRGFKKGASYIGGNIIMTEGGGVCKIATTLYNLVALSNQEIIERHNHSMPINYVPYGQDATVAFGVKDFKFKNTTEGNILIWSELIGNRLYMGFYGVEKPPKITWNHEISDVTEPSVKYVRNENLNKGEMKVVIEGLDGATVKSTLTITHPDGTVVMRDMGISKYVPLPRLIEIH